MLKSILFDHDDMDGAGCRIVFTLANYHLKLGEDYLIVHCSNNNVDDMVKSTTKNDMVDENTKIYFSDISASREVLEVLVKNFKTVNIWDHHRTNFFVTHIIPDATIMPENSLGVMESGTSLLFKHFAEEAVNNPKDPGAKYFLTNRDIMNVKINLEESDSARNGNFELFSELVDHIRSYDTYEWKTTNNMTAKKLQTLFFLLGMDRFCDRYVNRIINGDSNNDIIFPSDMDFVNSKLEFEQKVINGIGVEDVYAISNIGPDNLKAAFILSTAGANISEVGSQFLTKYPQFDIFVGFSFSRGGEFSFRCIRDDIDLGSTIAGPIGGGGHPKASGAPIPKEIIDSIADMLMHHIDNDCIVSNRQ